MLTINLLPPEEKNKVLAERVSRITRFFASSLMAISVVGSVLLLPSFLPLALERRELERSLAVAGKAAEAVEGERILSEIRGLRAELSKIENALERVPGAEMLFKILSSPEVEGIEIINLTVKESGEVALNGVAATRRNLLDYENSLSDSGLFASISSPLSNIIPETKINFAVKGVLKKDFGL